LTYNEKYGRISYKIRKGNKEMKVYNEEYKGHEIEIHIDEDYGNFFDNQDVFSKFVCFHRRYDLGNDKRFSSPDEVNHYINTHKKTVKAFPLYMYDHSGLTISLSPFSCPWDSGQLGYVLIEADDVKKEYGVKRITEKTWNKAISLMRSEVETYDKVIRGDVYGYIITDKDGNDVDSCWGFIGDIDDVVKEAKGFIDYKEKE